MLLDVLIVGQKGFSTELFFSPYTVYDMYLGF
jgi:hypothetical protein